MVDDGCRGKNPDNLSTGVMPLTGHKKHQPAESKPLVGMPSKRTVCPAREVSGQQSVTAKASLVIQEFPGKPQSGARTRPTEQAVAKRVQNLRLPKFRFLGASHCREVG